jgi:hypothetical protein
VLIAKLHNSKLAQVMRQRVKAKAPKCADAGAEIKLPMAQQHAAVSAIHS